MGRLALLSLGVQWGALVDAAVSAVGQAGASSQLCFLHGLNETPLC